MIGLLIAVSAVAGQVGSGRSASDAKTVTVTAEGVDRADAVKQALRKALERGAGAQIAAYSTVDNYELVRDTIYSRASGVVSDYRVLEEKQGSGGTSIVTVSATVRPDAVARTWGEVQNLLDQIGRPKIMVWIDERIDGRLQKESIVAARIEELFAREGFDLVARPKRSGVDGRGRSHGGGGGAVDRAARVARAAGARILIRGTANANRAGLERLYGVPAAFYNCDVRASVYYTDTGKLLATESLAQTRSGVRSRREFSPQAARAALVQATFPDRERPATRKPLANRIYEAVMEQWSTEITAGGEVELVIRGLDFESYIKTKDALGEIEGVRDIRGDFGAAAATFHIRTSSSGEMLALRLTKPPFDRWLSITGQRRDRIEMRRVGDP